MTHSSCNFIATRTNLFFRAIHLFVSIALTLNCCALFALCCIFCTEASSAAHSLHYIYYIYSVLNSLHYTAYFARFLLTLDSGGLISHKEIVGACSLISNLSNYEYKYKYMILHRRGEQRRNKHGLWQH